MSRKLPPATRRFLHTRDGRRARAVVLALHRWLDEQRLAVAELTLDHLTQFFAHPRPPDLSARASERYRALVRGYLQWLHDHDLLDFDPACLRPHQLPPIALEFIASLAPTRCRRTCHVYKAALRRFHRWLDPRGIEPQQLQRRDIVLWYQELHAAGLRPSSRLHFLVYVRAYLRWLSEHRRMQTAPDDLVRHADLPKLPQYLPRPLTTEADHELQHRLGHSTNPGAWALLLMRRTGLRIGELRKLEYHCVRHDGRHPLLKVPLGKMNNERLVPIDADLVELIQRLQSIAPHTRPRLVPGVRPALPPMSYKHLTRILAAHCDGVPEPAPITSHRLRHTYATEMLSAGMSLLGVMLLLGHRDYRMTLRYTAITPETVSNEYTKALAQLATKYRLPVPPRPQRVLDPDQILDHLSRWLCKHVSAGPHRRALLKRIERLRQEVRTLRPSTKK
jgi:site-specific recombinase XerD